MILETRLSAMLEAYGAYLTLGRTCGQLWCFQIPEITSRIVIGLLYQNYFLTESLVFFMFRNKTNPISVPSTTSGLGDFFLSFLRPYFLLPRKAGPSG